MMTDESKTTVSDDALKAFTKAIFRTADVSDEHAEVWADMLVWANLRGMDLPRCSADPPLYRLHEERQYPCPSGHESRKAQRCDSRD